jgi:hypothetical protein
VEFSPTSVPELDTILTKYRDTLFIPSVLSESHRRLIYRPSRHKLLLSDPGVTVTLPNDEDYKLQPMKLTDRPIKATSLSSIRRILASTDDDAAWATVLPFLEGMNQAKSSPSESFMVSLVRKAFEKGKYNLPMAWTEQAKRTGMRLCFKDITHEMMIGCHKRAAAADFKGDELISAAKHAERVAQLLEQEEHCAGKLKEGQFDMRKNVMVVGVLLELAAARAIHLHAGEDVDGKVHSYITKTIAMLEAGFPELVLPSSSEETYTATRVRNSMIGEYLRVYAPLWGGMKLASGVKGAVTPEKKRLFQDQMKALSDKLESAAAQPREGQTAFPRRGLQIYDQVKSL